MDPLILRSYSWVIISISDEDSRQTIAMEAEEGVKKCHSKNVEEDVVGDDEKEKMRSVGPATTSGNCRIRRTLWFRDRGR